MKPPAISGVTPSSVDFGGTPVIIHCVDPARVTAVTFGGAPATDVHVNAHGQLVCTTPLHVAADVDVSVTSDDGEQSLLRRGFTYLAGRDRSKADG
jgi:hypothetical protein